MKFLKLPAAVLVASMGFATSALSATVDTALSLVIDVSGSVDANEYALQRTGYVNAFTDAAVRAAILGGDNGGIAVNVIQFADVAAEAIGFVVLDSEAAIDTFVASLSSMSRLAATNPNGGTAFTNIVSGIQLATTTINNWIGSDDGAGGMFEAVRSVIDVSGDGPQNRPSGLNDAEYAALLRGARDTACGASGGIDAINGIAILGSPSFSVDYYKSNLICGDKSFAIGASGFDTFGSAIKTKLIAEITGENPNEVPLPMPLALMLTGFGGLGLLRKTKKA